MSADKVREDRLRRMAQRQGLTLRKSRRRDPRALDYGRYWLVDANNVVLSSDLLITLDEAERRLTGASD
jgi:hypothetical protein